jgi:uncharacterized protein GlcG (DUF336 family)
MGWLSTLVGRSQTRRPARSGRLRYVRLDGPEPLESRSLLSVSATLSSDGILSIVGDNGRNAIEVVPNGAQVVVSDFGKVVGQFDVNAVQSLDITTGNGQNTVTIDPALMQTAIVHCGAGSDNVFAGGGPAVVYGGAGTDKIFAGQAPDLLIAGSASTEFFEVKSSDTVNTVQGNRVFYASDPSADPSPSANTPDPNTVLSTSDVNQLLDRAAAATPGDNAIVALVDRNGDIVGVRVEGNVSPLVTGNLQTLTFAIDGAVAEARTGAFFANTQAPLTSRTVEFISQSTITQREVDSSPDITDQNSPQYGPGLVAPVGIGGHFPPRIAFTPQVDLFEIELTNRESGVNEPNGNIFNVPSQYIPSGVVFPQTASWGVVTGKLPTAQSRGIGTLPGGIPLYKNGTLVGGIGVFFPGSTGYASEENSSLSNTYDPSKPDLSLEAEYIAFAAAGGSSMAGYQIGTIAGVPPVPGFDLPFGRIDLVGITLDIYGPHGLQGPQILVNFGRNLGTGDPFSGVDEPVNSSGATLLPGTMPSSGWLVTPHAGGGLTAADVIRIIGQGIAQANQTRAAIRLPLGNRTKMVFAVTDEAGDVLGLYRMPDATIFSEDVAVAKARNVAYYDDAAALQPQDQIPGIPKGASFTARTFRFLGEPFFPEGQNGLSPAPFSPLNDPNIDPNTGLNSGPPLPASAYTSVIAYVAFHPSANFHDPYDPANQNGVVFFPGSSALYKNDGTIIVGGLGVSGDGVDQDDVVTYAASMGYTPAEVLKADQFFFQSVRLPYQKFNRNPDA